MTLPPRLATAYAYCERVAQRHYENFPVASMLLPACMRHHIAAIYAFARRADDFADEPGMPDEERLRRLTGWRERLHEAVARKGASPGFDQDEDALVFIALGHTIDERSLPIALLEDLLSAFTQDVTTKRYATWAQVLDYCRRSANPIGRLVLRIAGHHDTRLDDLSDAVCSALQLTNFWQDLERDWRAGRLYVPKEILDVTGASERALDAKRLTPEWRAALSAVTVRTRALYAAGRTIGDSVRGRLRWELRLTWLGGSRILDKLERRSFDVFRERPTLDTADIPWLAWQALRWR